MTRDSARFAGTCVAWLLLSSLILVHFHDQFWWGPDEGVYAYVAQRFLAGDTLHRDLIDIHPGYGNFLNIAAFALFGEDLLSLRYPLVLLTLLQGGIALWVLRTHGNLVAFVGALAVTAFSFIQFLNPSANWHALGAYFALLLCLTALPRGSSSRLLLAGLIVGIAFFTRQLSGVLLGIGLVAVLLSELEEGKTGKRMPAAILGGVPTLGLAAYVMLKDQFFGALWIGVWPIILLAVLTWRARLTWVDFARITMIPLTGFILSGIPIAVFMAASGALMPWLRDLLFSALVINSQAFIADRSYAEILAVVYVYLPDSDTTGVISSLGWLALLLTFPVAGILSVSRILARQPLPLPAISAMIWATSALHYQIPFYLMVAVAPILLGLLCLSNRPFALAFVGALSFWAIFFQAGRPIEQSLAGIVFSEAAKTYVASDLPRVSLRISEESRALYSQVVSTIEQEARKGEALFTLPMNPEINFITGRKAPVPYYGTQLGLKNREDLEDTIEALDQAAPLFVVHRRKDKYLTPLGADLLKAVQMRSARPRQIGPFDLYRYSPPSPEWSSSPVLKSPAGL